MIRYRLWVWVLCLVFPTWVWAENETRTCTSFTQQGRQVTFHLTDGAALQLQLCSSSVVKIWFSPDGQLQRRNASFAVINEELEEVGTIHVDEQAACYEIFTPKLRIRVNKSPMSLQIFDKYQKLLFSDYADKGHVSEGTKKVEYKVLRRDEHFFGLREKAKKLEATIEPRLLTAFKRIRKGARNGLAVVYVQRGACGGCFNKIPPQKQLDIKLRKKIIVCEYCGRIMIDPELAGVED